MTSKQRAYLRGLASKEDAILHIGKGGMNENIVKQANDALEARDLLAEECSAEVICAIGSKAVLYRRSQKKPKIELPK